MAWLVAGPGSGIPVCKPLFPPGGAPEPMKRFVAPTEACEQRGGLSSPAGLWHFPEKVPRRGGENALPTHPLAAHPAFSDPSALWGWGWAWAQTPILGAPVPLPTEGRGPLGEPGGEEGCGAPPGGERTFFHRLQEECTSVPSSELGELGSSQLCALTPNRQAPAGMGIVSMCPEAATMPTRVPFPAPGNRRRGSGQFWEARLW